MIIHGFMDGFGNQWVHDMKNEIHTKDNVAIIVVRWGELFFGRGFWKELFLERYMKGARNTRYIGYAIHLMLLEMHKTIT